MCIELGSIISKNIVFLGLYLPGRHDLVFAAKANISLGVANARKLRDLVKTQIMTEFKTTTT